ncbi:MAG: hypothetical protein ED556_04235 [Winogradskyella sp.]|uniref:hypothetical protein n=1 Tax=Winogradskyella sp. TaxID=1883156 RepID=UPI000F3BB923|nr:hypothetical protein [Winogradskyella sp.]RNC88400.1 MAG: hypothetical protein ED556_04235 [Winogradskyella sp.]
MKRLLINTMILKKLILILVVFSTMLNYAQNQEATLHFKEGESIKGYASILGGNRIEFRLSLEDEPDIWTGDIVTGVTFHGFEFERNFEYVFTKNFRRYPSLLEVLEFGEVKLFVVRSVIGGSNFVDNGIGGKFPSNYQYSKNKYYVKRDSEDYAIRLKGNFKKTIRTYFGECPGINKRIKSHEFRWATLPDLVRYYNDYCTDLD